jgi:hypothetical protein
MFLILFLPLFDLILELFVPSFQENYYLHIPTQFRYIIFLMSILFLFSTCVVFVIPCFVFLMLFFHLSTN